MLSLLRFIGAVSAYPGLFTGAVKSCVVVVEEDVKSLVASWNNTAVNRACIGN